MLHPDTPPTAVRNRRREQSPLFLSSVRRSGPGARGGADELSVGDVIQAVIDDGQGLDSVICAEDKTFDIGAPEALQQIRDRGEH